MESELLNNCTSLKTLEIINKWENIGFLTDVKNKRNVAIACDITALYLINKLMSNKNITLLYHPVIVRIFKNIEKDLEIDIIMTKTIEIIKLFSVFYVENISYSVNNNLDFEPELVARFCDGFKINFKNYNFLMGLL